MAFLLVSLIASASCREGVAPPPQRPADSLVHDPVYVPRLTTLIVGAPAAILVNENALLTVQGRSERNSVMVTPPLTWTSSDQSVAQVFADGVIRGVGRGSASITATAAGVSATVAVRVKADVHILPQYYLKDDRGYYWEIATGDRLQLVATYVDVNGVTIDDSVDATWRSSNSALATVNASGILVGISHGYPSTITATTTDGDGSANVRVSEQLAGLPATLRLAHAIEGLGPITFRRNNAAPTTLAFGESVDLPIGSGTVLVSVAGLPHSRGYGTGVYQARRLVGGGQHLALYAVGALEQAFVTEGWSTSAAIGPDSGLVRFVEGWNYSGGIIYLRAAGAAVTGLPELCYFDPGTISSYYPRARGDFDAIVEAKYQSARITRLRATALAGRARTFVFVGDSARMRLLAFDDP